MNKILYKFVPKSSNRKIGPIPTTYTSENSCPDSCAFYKSSCYAELGYVGMVWKKVKKGFPNVISELELFSKLKNMPEGQTWRMNTAGDLPSTKKGKINKNFLKKLTKIANKTRIICYTHHHDVENILWANNNGFPLIMSLNDKSELSDYAGVVPTAMVVPYTWQMGNNESQGDYKKRTLDNLAPLRSKYENQKIFICPATYTSTNCMECGACAKMTKNDTVCFPGHGSRKKQITE